MREQWATGGLLIRYGLDNVDFFLVKKPTLHFEMFTGISHALRSLRILFRTVAILIVPYKTRWPQKKNSIFERRKRRNVLRNMHYKLYGRHLNFTTVTSRKLLLRLSRFA